MKIELKNIKHSAFASQETYCYKASLYVDGSKIGVVSNDGHGGADYFEGDRQAFKNADEWLQKNERLALEQLGTDVPMDMESKCAELVSYFLAMRDYKSKAKKCILFTKQGSDAVFVTNNTPAQIPQFKEFAKKQPVKLDKILNELPDDEALKIYMKAA